MTTPPLPARPNLADVKGHLAALGADVSPEAQLIHRRRRGKPGSLVVVERVTRDAAPDYEIEGFGTCVSCRSMCYLDHKSARLAVAGASPVCQECAAEWLPRTEGT